MFKKIILFLIRVYQLIFSPDQGILGRLLGRCAFLPTCRFYPTCSQYTYQSVKKYGAAKGLLAGARRILRCHPWSEDGYDPVG